MTEPAPHIRFRIFPQAVFAGEPARLTTIALTRRVGEVGPGPQDARLYAIEAEDKPPYDGRTLPPWRGPASPAAPPGPDGHFDHLAPGQPGFRAAHLYACARFTLDCWERFAERPIRWHFADAYPRLELAAIGPWRNAHMGWGYLEAGRRGPGIGEDYALNFDVIAHEIGHALLMSAAGPFDPARSPPDYAAFHEASADLVALIAALHLPPVRAEVLDATQGDLDSVNRLTRFGEISHTRQIRLANNRATMADFAAGWRHEHDLALPALGGFFDHFVDLYHALLVADGVIAPELEDLADRAEADPALRTALRRGFARAYALNPQGFDDALCDARDALGALLAELWPLADPERFRFVDLPALAAEAERRATGGRFRRMLARNLLRRNFTRIPLGPRRGADRHSHFHSARTVIPVNNASTI